MSIDQHALRRVAIVVAALDRPEADRLLDRFSDDEARAIRQAILDIGDVPADEEQQALVAFCRLRRNKADDAGVELDEGLRARLQAAPSKPRPFGFAAAADVEDLAEALASERPQTVALVLAQLERRQAAAVLEALPGGQQAEVVARLGRLEAADPSIVEELERALEARLREIGRNPRLGPGRAARAAEHAGGSVALGMAPVANVVSYSSGRPGGGGRPAPSFADLAALADRDWAAVLSSVDPDVAVTALIGADPRLVDRFLRRLPAADARALRRRLDHPGPIRLRDVDDARNELAAAAGRLASEGRIELGLAGAAA